MEVCKWYQSERLLYLNHFPILPSRMKDCIYEVIRRIISYKTITGKNKKFTYQGLGTLINKKAISGCVCIIHKNVIVGSGESPDSTIVIGDNVDIGIGTVIFGDIHIGNKNRIVSNEMMNKNFPDNRIAVCIPAKSIRFICRGNNHYG